ncbi:hypothetical protein [Ligilactobacillus salivarius]|uniref:hypothetical protein n=1 Tax=Ligilactobacillus salivarius TaxID=1624 RepID=UPI00136FA062|nr:hypothetical protein [Ligilactobacillus salivarius]MYV10534.1 hypothetical protein [Ligilactobacillus salivarius]
MAKKTIKYLENGEYHDATVKDVGTIEELKTESKDNLVEAINEIFLGGGKGFSDLQQKVDESTQAAKNAQQAADKLQQKLDEVAQNVGLSEEEAQKLINQAVEDAKRTQTEALQAYKDAQKELDDSMAQFMEDQKAINKELEQAKTDIQGDIDQKNTEIKQINAVIESTKSDLTATSAQLASVRNDLTNAQMDWGKVRTEITNINGKLDSKMSNTDFDKYKERIEHNETEITQTKNELQSKATKQDLDVLTGTVTTQGGNITQLAGKIEEKVSKDTLANDIDDFQVKKANIFTGTREFMDWQFSNNALGRVNDDIYNHSKVAELHNGSNLSMTVDGLEVGKTYSVSIFAKVDHTNSGSGGVQLMVDNGTSFLGVMKTVYTPHDTKVTNNWQRYYATIVASATTMKFVFDRYGMASDTTLYLNRPKLEIGETVYAWEDNAQDIYKRVEHTEAQFDVYNDQISGIVKKQTETDKKIENVSSTFTQRADGIETNSKKYTDDKATGLAEELSGKLKATSEQLSAEYEKQTNAKIGALSDGGSNLILNSSFLVTDDNGNATLENWRDVSAKVGLTTPSGLDGIWIKSNRSTTGTLLGARTNYFPVKQGKLVIGVDIALDGSGDILPYILRIEYYDVSNNRVNYVDVTLQNLGLSTNQVTKSGSNFRCARGVYKTSNDRSDVVKACIVVPETVTGYDMYLTNFFAKFSDVNDGTYEVNPLDQQASLIKQRTKIEQDSEKINLLNTQTEKLGNDIKATNASIGVLKGEVDLKASQSIVNDLTNRVSKNEADIKVFPDKIKSEVSKVSQKIDGVNDKVDNIKVGGTNLLKRTSRDLQQKSTTNDWVRLPYNTDFFRSIYPLDNFTAKVWIEKPNKDSWLQAYVGGNGLFKGNVIKAGQSGYSEVHGTLNKDITGANLVIGAGDGLSVSLSWKELKLEKGDVATDWSPAPEDLQEGINTATTKATQTDTKFERMISQIQYNDSTGEIGKYEHKITELANGTQEKISAIQTDSDKKLQSATQTLTNKIGDLESTVRTNTTNIGQYRQEMTNTAKEWSTKFTSIQDVVNSDGGGINLAKHTSNKLTNITASPCLFVGSSASTSFNNLQDYQGKYMTVRVWIEKPSKDAWVQIWTDKKTIGGNVIKAGQSGYSTAGGIIPTGFSAWNILVGQNDSGSVTFGWKEFKIELGNVATPWTPNPDDTDNKIGLLQGQITANADKFNTVYTKTDIDNKINPLNSRTEFLQDNSQFLLRVQQAGAATGGVNNLLTNSDTFDGYYENNTSNFDFQKIEGSGLPAVPNQPSITMMGHVWDDYGSAYNKNDGIYLENGETYWFGVYIMTDSTAGAFENLSIYASTDKNKTSDSPNKSFFSESVDYNKHFGGRTKVWKWNVFKLTGDGTTRYNWRIEPFNHTGGSIWTAGYMLVKSPLPPTSWSPNMTDVQMRLDSGGVTINGNTTINGELNAQDVVLKGKSSTMALNGDGGVGIFSNDNSFATRLTGDSLEFDLNSNNAIERLGSISAAANTAENNVNGITVVLTPQQTLGKPYGGDEFAIGKATSINNGKMSIANGMIYNATGANKATGFHWYDEEYKHGKGTLTHIEEARDPLFWTGRKWSTSTQPFYVQPTVQLGHNANSFGDSGVTLYWNSIKPFGNVDMTDARIWMADAQANLRFGWTNWSDWTGKLPSMYRTEWGRTQGTGGIAIGYDGNVILFGGGKRWDINHRM